MEASVLDEILKPEDKNFTYVDVPELVTNIKEELISEEVYESTDNIRIKEECASRSEEQFHPSSFLSLGQVKTEIVKNEVVFVNWNTAVENIEINSQEASSALNKEKSNSNSLEDCNLFKFEEVNIKGEEQGNGVPSSKYQKDDETKIPRRGIVHKCTECNYRTIRKNHMKSHVRQHSSLRDDHVFKCYKCDFQNSHKGNFRRHVQKCQPCEYEEGGGVDEVAMMTKCSECDYKTFDKRNLYRHVLLHKSSEEVRMHKCSECEYQTKYKSNLNLHARRHKRRTETDILKCSECEFQTFSKNNLNLHIIRHKSAENVKTHKCLECGYITLKKSHLRGHALRHLNPAEVEMYKCLHCEYQTKRKGDLNRHLLSHRVY